MTKKNYLLKNNGRLASVILVWILIGTFVVIVVPINTPTVQGQIYHGSSAAMEDGDPQFDNDGFPGIKNNYVLWHNDDHIIGQGGQFYYVEDHITLEIPAMNDGANTIRFLTGVVFDVRGTLLTNTDGTFFTATKFEPNSSAYWTGMIFHQGSKARLQDIWIKRAALGLRFEPGAELLAPGIQMAYFEDWSQVGVGMQMDGAVGYTNMDQVTFNDPNGNSTGLHVLNQDLNITSNGGRSRFDGHRTNNASLHITNSNVYLSGVLFRNDYKVGPSLYIDGDASGTVASWCEFDEGVSGNHYVESEGAPLFLDNCTFVTSGGILSVEAHDNLSALTPATVVLKNPSADLINGPDFGDDSFDNSTMTVTDNSSIELQWSMNVNVMDPNANPVDNAPVWVVDRNDDPASPPSVSTDASGWAKWFTTTELIRYSSSTVYYNPFNVSAMNNSVLGYANPEPDMGMMREISLMVPFSQVLNTPPLVSWIQAPSGIQTGLVSIQFRLDDPDIGDDGNMSVTVEFWHPINSVWMPATIHPSSDPTTNLDNDTIYTIVWDSKDVKDFADQESTQVKINITPFDKGSEGPPGVTGEFHVDNKGPQFVSGPTVNVDDTTALIEWIMDEASNASVHYGLDGTITDTTTGSTGSTLQSVLLTDLQPGRNYTFSLESEDLIGNLFTSSSPYYFETEIHIQLYEGWNMISIPPIIMDYSVDAALSSISGQYTAVQMYNPSDANDPWKDKHTGKTIGNDLNTITTEAGIWILMKSDDVLVPDHVVIPTGSPAIQVQLVKGWNFVGYPSVTTRTVSNALSGVSGSYNMVQYYDSITDQWLWSDGTSGTLTNMELGKGYWIHCTQDAMWNVQYV